jgi:hypothetical protein
MFCPAYRTWTPIQHPKILLPDFLRSLISLLVLASNRNPTRGSRRTDHTPQCVLRTYISDTGSYLAQLADVIEQAARELKDGSSPVQPVILSALCSFERSNRTYKGPFDLIDMIDQFILLKVSSVIPPMSKPDDSTRILYVISRMR